ncbi:MAG: PilZ domain-containing protein [Nannocystaceae bacterium]|nr:PilZ domain-containing protein [bacterium]
MQRTHSEISADPAQDRRHRPRVTVAVPFRLYDDSRARLLLHARTLDLSTGGALLHGVCKVEVGSPVRVEISRGPARNPLALGAIVVRIHAPLPSTPHATPGNHGVAVRFNDLSPIDETVLAGIIQEARA